MKLFILSLAFIVSSCTHSLHEAHVSDFSSTFKQLNQGQMVEAKTEQFVVLGFVNDTNYVEQAYADLQKKCSGNLQGITTQYSTDHGFFSWTNHIYMQGLCLK